MNINNIVDNVNEDNEEEYYDGNDKDVLADENEMKIIIDNINEDNEENDNDGNDKDVLAGPGERKRCATDRGSRTS